MSASPTKFAPGSKDELEAFLARTGTIKVKVAGMSRSHFNPCSWLIISEALMVRLSIPL